MSTYYSMNEADKPANERRYHDNDGCPPGVRFRHGTADRVAMAIAFAASANE